MTRLGWLAVAGVLLVGACGSSTDNPQAQPGKPSHGTTLDQPYVLPHVTLTDTDGHRVDLREVVQEKPLTLMYFGYIHCPDVCPTTMVDLATALRKIDPEQRKRIAVAFVTTDPWRDTPASLKRWLANFDPTFRGYTGSYDAIRRAAKAAAVGTIRPERTTGNYEVSHGAWIPAFERDGRARVTFSTGTLPEDYVTDLPKVLTAAEQRS